MLGCRERGPWYNQPRHPVILSRSFWSSRTCTLSFLEAVRERECQAAKRRRVGQMSGQLGRGVLLKERHCETKARTEETWTLLLAALFPFSVELLLLSIASVSSSRVCRFSGKRRAGPETDLPVSRKQRGPSPCCFPCCSSPGARMRFPAPDEQTD